MESYGDLTFWNLQAFFNVNHLWLYVLLREMFHSLFFAESDSVMDMSGLSNHSSFSSEPFLTLEPPLSESDYSFSLGDGEGLTDLFDFAFWEGTEADLQCQLCQNEWDECSAILVDNRYKYWGNAAPSVIVAMSSDGACGWGMRDYQ